MSTTAVKSKQVRNGDSAFQIVNVIVMLIAGFITLYPFWQLLVLSFNDAIDAYAGGVYFWPREWTLRNYQIVFNDPAILQAGFVSVARTVVGTILSLMVEMASTSDHFIENNTGHPRRRMPCRVVGLVG